MQTRDESIAEATLTRKKEFITFECEIFLKSNPKRHSHATYSHLNTPIDQSERA